MVDEPRKFPPGCGPNARRNIPVLQRSYSVGTIKEDVRDGGDREVNTIGKPPSPINRTFSLSSPLPPTPSYSVGKSNIPVLQRSYSVGTSNIPILQRSHSVGTSNIPVHQRSCSGGQPVNSNTIGKPVNRTCSSPFPPPTPRHPMNFGSDKISIGRDDIRSRADMNNGSFNGNELLIDQNGSLNRNGKQTLMVYEVGETSFRRSHSTNSSTDLGTNQASRIDVFKRKRLQEELAKAWQRLVGVKPASFSGVRPMNNVVEPPLTFSRSYSLPNPNPNHMAFGTTWHSSQMNDIKRPKMKTEEFMSIGTSQAKNASTSMSEEEKVANMLQRMMVAKRLSLFRIKYNELSVSGDFENVNFALQAWKLLKCESGFEEPIKMLGHIPGVEFGDEFIYRVELMIVGMHSCYNRGIDFMMHHGKILATCVVTTKEHIVEGYSNDVFTYIGEAEHFNPLENFFPDQKFKGGNLALRNSLTEKTPVRVVRCMKTAPYHVSTFTAARFTKYVYDGLYVVTKCEKQNTGQGTMIYKFEFRRLHEV